MNDSASLLPDDADQVLALNSISVTVLLISVKEVNVLVTFSPTMQTMLKLRRLIGVKGFCDVTQTSAWVEEGCVYVELGLAWYNLLR